MFARSCPRMGMRFASGNVFYMNRTFTTRHLNSVASPLSAGFITPMRFASSVNFGTLNQSGIVPATTAEVADITGVTEAANGSVAPQVNWIELMGGLNLAVSLKITTVCCIGYERAPLVLC